MSSSKNNEREEVELAGRWLQTCLAEHEQCKARQASSASSFGASIPTRLIKITSSGTNVESICIVSRPESESSVTAYLTLSHCWGGANIVKLKQENLVQFHKRIPPELLPKTFFDAIRITLLLGYEYLWIDSLCIIQDSTEDWLQQSKVMGSVYRNSTLTIAAVGAKDSHGGCFLASRDMRSVSKLGWTGELSLLKTNEMEKEQPLHRRALVLQEQCLSVRTLNFGIHEISWDCIETRASTSEPVLQSNLYSISTKRCFEDLLLSVSKHLWILYWWQLVHNYTNRKATFSTDRWEAIRGLAAEVERANGRTLLYGLWSDRIKFELLWETKGVGTQRLNIGAPSWSWLSVTGPVTLDMVWLSSHQPGIDATIHAPWFRSNSSSTVEARPYLTVSALMAPITLTPIVPPGRGGRYNFTFSDSVLRYGGFNCRLDSEEESCNLYALQLMRGSYDTTTGTKSHGLVVVPADERNISWRRVGIYEADAYEPFTKRYEIMLV